MINLKKLEQNDKGWKNKRKYVIIRPLKINAVSIKEELKHESFSKHD